MEPSTQQPVEKPPIKKLTKEEKKQLQKLKQEEENAKVARDEMLREMALASKIIKENRLKWVTIRKEVETPAIKDAVYYIWHSFEYACDTKDALINELLQMIEIRESIAQAMFTDTAEHIFSLLRNFYKTSEHTRAQAELCMATYKDRFTELDAKRQNEGNVLDYMKTINYSNTEVYGLRQETFLGEFFARKETIVSVYMTELEIWLHHIKTTVLKLWNEYWYTIGEYKLATDKMKRKMSFLKTKVKASDQMIQAQRQQISAMKAKVEKYKEIINSESFRSNNKTIADLQTDRTKLKNSLIDINKKFEQNSQQATNRLKCLVSASNSTISVLQSTESKGQRLLALHLKCARLETPHEQNRKRQIATIKTMFKNNEVANKMASFWNQYNQVEILVKLTQAKKNYFLRRNASMEAKLKCYIDMRSDMVPPKSMNLQCFPLKNRPKNKSVKITPRRI